MKQIEFETWPKYHSISTMDTKMNTFINGSYGNKTVASIIEYLTPSFRRYLFNIQHLTQEITLKFEPEGL